jgi:PBP1b-binding outer membrane lipoprotein LpoB
MTFKNNKYLHMKSKSIYSLLVVFLIVISCKKDKVTPKLSYEETKQSTANKTKSQDTTSVKIADLPVFIEGTKYLIHPIGEVRVNDYVKNSYSSSSSKINDISYSISNYDGFELTGYFDDLKFQHIDSTTVRSLTNEKVQIQRVAYLNTIAEKTKKQILVYTLMNNDTNKDGIINQDDIKSLALSFADGTNFVKVSEDFNEVLDWNVVEVQNRLYFRCVEDINKNGAFDKNDKVHYHFVNLLDSAWKVEEYMPI